MSPLNKSVKCGGSTGGGEVKGSLRPTEKILCQELHRRGGAALCISRANFFLPALDISAATSNRGVRRGNENMARYNGAGGSWRTT